jgi:uncharacterized membrane protein YphA (DoxX/SURF4 family)
MPAKTPSGANFINELVGAAHLTFLMIDSRRYLGIFAIFALVFLRVVIGWHFFREGAQKIEYDRHEGELRLASTFSSEPFLSQAKGPLAKWFHAQAPDDHGFNDLLSVPRQNVPSDDKQKADPPYNAWQDRIQADWAVLRDDVKSLSGLTNEQKQQVDEIYNQHVQQLDDYLKTQEEAMIEHQHELWRLGNWEQAPEAGQVPFVDERIGTKSAETSAQTRDWINEVQAIEADYISDLREIPNTEQRPDEDLNSKLNSAVTTREAERLYMVNLGAAILTLGVGICLLLGLFTRLASIVGALFLLTVVASQPPWLPDTVPTMNQIIEFAGLLVLAGTGAGRWAGLDFFTYALFHRNREVDV